MNNLLQLFIRNGGFITFFILEVLSIYLLVGNNQRQGEIYAHSYGLFAGKVLNWQSGMREYFHLREEVEALRAENADLRTQNINARLVEVPYRDTFFHVLYDTLTGQQGLHRRLVRPAYEFVPATVIGNSISLNNNWLMINRGTADSITANMGVMSDNGVVGIVRHTDAHLSSVMSVLHRQTRISCAVKNKSAIGSLVWEDNHPRYMTLKDVPRHVEVAEGDTILTSGYSSLFPGGLLVGFVEGNPKTDRENQYFYTIRVRLTQDPADVHHVYVVRNLFRTTIDSLEKLTYERQ